MIKFRVGNISTEQPHIGVQAAVAETNTDLTEEQYHHGCGLIAAREQMQEDRRDINALI